jgi:hypothetical protein
MSNVFNTTFEISLRVLLTLEAAPRKWQSANRIAAADFIATYGKDFGIADENLHGENSYKYSEFTLRCERTREALKLLTARQRVDVEIATDSFVFTLSRIGSEYCANLEGSYADEYRELASRVEVLTANLSEREVMSLISKKSVSSIRE